MILIKRHHGINCFQGRSCEVGSNYCQKCMCNFRTTNDYVVCNGLYNKSVEALKNSIEREIKNQLDILDKKLKELEFMENYS
jgi:hypothetical protein